MLKLTEVYRVNVSLNEGSSLSCLLLSKPDSFILAAVASAENASPNLGEAVALAQVIAIPVLGEDVADSDIMVAGTILGKIQVETLAAYGVSVKRGRKPKPAGSITDPANKPKRGRRPRVAAATAVSEVTPIV